MSRFFPENYIRENKIKVHNKEDESKLNEFIYILYICYINNILISYNELKNILKTRNFETENERKLNMLKYINLNRNESRFIYIFNDIDDNKIKNINNSSLSSSSHSSSNSVDIKKNFKKQNSKKLKNKNEKIFKERNGDWSCFFCKNLNFTFRTECNRCKKSKIQSEKCQNEYLQSLLKIIEENDKKRKNVDIP